MVVSNTYARLYMLVAVGVLDGVRILGYRHSMLGAKGEDGEGTITGASICIGAAFSSLQRRVVMSIFRSIGAEKEQVERAISIGPNNREW